MSQWGKHFKIAGVTVLPDVGPTGFDRIHRASLINDFMIISAEAGADLDRTRAILEPYRGKPYGELLDFLNELCVAPAIEDGRRYIPFYDPNKAEAITRDGQRIIRETLERKL